MLVEITPKLSPLAPRFVEFAQNGTVGLLQFLLAIIIAGFLFAPGPKIVQSISRLFDQLVRWRGREVLGLIGATIRNVSRSVIGVSLLQTALASVGFVYPEPGLWPASRWCWGSYRLARGSSFCR